MMSIFIQCNLCNPIWSHESLVINYTDLSHMIIHYMVIYWVKGSPQYQYWGDIRLFFIFTIWMTSCLVLFLLAKISWCLYKLRPVSWVALLPTSLNCPFFIAPSVFSNVYFQQWYEYPPPLSLLHFWLYIYFQWNFFIISSLFHRLKWSLALIIITFIRNCTFQW